MVKSSEADLTSVAEHYEFGKNWADFAARLSESSIAEAEKGMVKLLHADELVGRTFLDIGCGSGLHSLAALRLGVRSVMATDIDPDSVETTRTVLSRYAGSSNWSVRVQSVFDLRPDQTYDVVYSWGVLHHTGDMHRAIRSAAALVAPAGLMCLALYRKTPLCGLWKVEKRVYTSGPEWLRWVFEKIFLGAVHLRFWMSGRNYKSFNDDYVRNRGMSYETDMRDWLGGYPYESISEAATLKLFEELGFDSVRRFCVPPGPGVFGSGCDEYVFRRRSKDIQH